MAELQWDSGGKADPAVVWFEGGEEEGGGTDAQPSKIKTALLLVRKII